MLNSIKDYEEEEDEDEESTMFERECELLESRDGGATANSLGTVYLRIVYDDDVYGARIVAEKKPEGGEGADDAEWTTVCNHLIAIQTTLAGAGDARCKWSALDFSTDPPTYRSFEAAFSTPADAAEFKESFNEGKELADQSEIIELPADNSENPVYYGEGRDYES